MADYEMEKIIKALQNCSVQNDVGCQQCPYFEERKKYGHEWCTTSMAQDTYNLLKEKQEEIEDLRTAMQSMIEGQCVIVGNKQQRWISVEERLPNSPGEFDYLVCRDDGYVTQASFLNVDKYHVWLSGIDTWLKDITHWMPLPSPYKATLNDNKGSD